MGSVILGATSLEQLRENLEAFSLPDLDPATLKTIDAIDEGLSAAYYKGVQVRALPAAAAAAAEDQPQDASTSRPEL